MKKKWIIVAESSRARIFSVENRKSPLKEVDDLVNMAIQSDSNEASLSDGNGLGGRHGMEPRMEPKQVETIHFAQDVCERLDQARRKGECNDLVIISSPSFLGLLKRKLDSVTQKHISKTINKNLIRKSESEIRNYVFS